MNIIIVKKSCGRTTFFDKNKKLIDTNFKKNSENYSEIIKILIVTYITIGVFSGREFEERKIILRFNFALAIKGCRKYFLYFLIILH